MEKDLSFAKGEVEVVPEKTVAEVRLPLLELQLVHAVVRLSGL